MNEGLIPNRYAKALYKFSQEKGEAKQVYEEMKQLSNSFAMVDTLRKAIDNPYLHALDKEKVLLTASGAKKDGCVDKFIMMVIKNNREECFRSIALAYEKIYRTANGIAQVEITTANKMPASELAKIKNVVAIHEKGKIIELTTHVDNDLIGGFVVKIDSVLLDASIKNELKKLRLKLLSN
ncbi:MAG: ATP synthase F1 subunit delta [Muribaculaceae bacterium]